MELSLDNPPTVAAPFADRFAHVARLDLDGGALLMLSGQIAVDEAGDVVAPGDAGAQAELIFDTIGRLLAAHGATFADVLHIRVYLTDFDDLPAYAAARGKRFPAGGAGLPPASTALQVSRLLLPGLVIELEVTAAVARPAAG